MERSLRSREFVSGFEVEKHSMTWRIEGFALIRNSKKMIDSQSIDFTAGESTGRLSHWTVYMEDGSIDETDRWIGIHLKLNSPKATDPTLKNSYAQIQYVMPNKDGKIVKYYDTEMVRFGSKFEERKSTIRGVEDLFVADDECDNQPPEEALEIQITFKLYTPAQPKSAVLLEAIKDKFQITFSDRLRKDFAGLLKTPEFCTGIKIISNDKTEFTVPRGILSARSEVFAVMLGSDMNEANSGVIELPDISSPALDVLLNFIYTGDLLPAWKETEVIVELTNAAAKYQLQDLLHFLDAAMGKVCQLQNVGALSNLARQLSLKVAEEELLSFVRKEGYGSLDNFILMWNTELPVGCGDVADKLRARELKSRIPVSARRMSGGRRGIFKKSI